MTELEVILHIPETALAEHLSASGEASALAPYLGALTHSHLDAPAAETEALLTGIALHDLGWLRRVAVRGEDRYRWLSGMVTNTVELADHTGAYNLILNAQGRIQGDAYVWRSGDALTIELTAEQYEPLMAHFDRFIIMDDVELVPASDLSAIGLTGPQASQLLEKFGLPTLPEPLTSISAQLGEIPLELVRSHGPIVPHYQLWAGTAQIPALWQALRMAGATPVGSAALETLRIAEGIPAYATDIQSRDLAQETAQDRALSFTKGCYLGQEIVERIRSRGQVHRHLRSLELIGDQPLIGTELRLANSEPDSKPVGTLTSVAALQLAGVTRIFAIGMIRAEAEVGNKPLSYPGGSARILTSAPKLT